MCAQLSEPPTLSAKERQEYEEKMERQKQLAIEAITNIRTVAGLGREKMFVKRYIQELDHPHVQAKRKSHLRGKKNYIY